MLEFASLYKTSQAIFINAHPWISWFWTSSEDRHTYRQTFVQFSRQQPAFAFVLVDAPRRFPDPRGAKDTDAPRLQRARFPRGVSCSTGFLLGCRGNPSESFLPRLRDSTERPHPNSNGRIETRSGNGSCPVQNSSQE